MSDTRPLPAPHRAYELEIKIGGDTWQDVLRHLHELQQHIPDHGEECNSVSGGSTSNHIVIVGRYPEMTHDRYVQELDEYLAMLRAHKSRSSHE